MYGTGASDCSFSAAASSSFCVGGRTFPRRRCGIVSCLVMSPNSSSSCMASYASLEMPYT